MVRMVVSSVQICGIGLKLSLIATYSQRVKTSKSHQTNFGANFTHNVNFPGKPRKFTEILLARMAVSGVQICETSIDCQIASGSGPQNPTKLILGSILHMM